MSQKKTFGQLLRDRRLELNWSQAHFVDVCSLSSIAYLSDLENDRRPPPKYDVLLNLIKGVGIDPVLALHACAYSLRYLKEINKNG